MKQLVFLLFVLGATFDAAADFRAAIAVRTVTPDPLLPVIGGIGAARPVTRKEGELTVRALVFEEGTNRVAIVSSDFLGFPAALGTGAGLPPNGGSHQRSSAGLAAGAA